MTKNKAIFYLSTHIKQLMAEEPLQEQEDFPTIIRRIKEIAVETFDSDFVDLQNNIELDEIEYFTINSFCIRFRISCPENISKFYDIDVCYWWELPDEEILKLVDTIDLDDLITSGISLFCIIVHFHNLSVANENGDSTIIEDIYAKTCLSYDGRIVERPVWYRTTYSETHYSAGYCHSHLNSQREGQRDWSTPCLGSGPICTTILGLGRECDLSIWRLYWYELTLCISTESLVGGPYIKIKEIPSRNDSYKDYYGFAPKSYTFDIKLERAIIKYLVKSGKIKFCYQNGQIKIADSFVNINLLISEAVFNYAVTQKMEPASDYLAKRLRNGYLYYGTIMADGGLRLYENSVFSTSPGGSIVARDAGFQFKGQPVKIIVNRSADSVEYKYIFLEQLRASRVVEILTILANIIYGEKSKRKNKVNKRTWRISANNSHQS